MTEPTRTSRAGGGRPTVMTFRRWKLRVDAQAGAPAQEVTIESRRATIGSSAGNELVLTDRSVSRQHAEITVDERGFLLRDLNSKNGTWMDGARILAAFLRPGSVIQVGNTRVVFSADDETVEIPLSAEASFGRLVGPSPEMRALFAVLEKVSPEDVTVLIQGESGTGKEIVATEIHGHSRRAAEPFVVFDAGATSESLLESELFGHVKGAFTDATSDRLGAFRSADRGTLFLDEIGELPLALQPKLLRLLESREVRPVGSSKPVRCDVRLIAATNRDLEDEVKRGAFREDLFFRLNVLRVRIPPLRHHREDLPALVAHLLKRVSGEGAAPEMSPEVMAMLDSHGWPGNVRELKHFVERYLVLGPKDVGDAADLLAPARRRGMTAKNSLLRLDLPFKDAKQSMVDGFEVQYCRSIVKKHRGNITAAAREAGIHRHYLERLVKKHGLK